MSKVKKFAPTIVFCAFIGIMCILFFALPKQEYSSSEKRYLESFPEFNTKTFFDGKFGTEFEKYLSDHMAGRKFFVGLNAYYDLYSGRNGTGGVYKGSNNYLINDPPTDQLKDGKENSDLAKNVEYLNDFVKAHNIKATMMIVPSTGYIMKDVLPTIHFEYKDDLYYEIINKKATAMTVVDIRDTFKEKSKNTQLYYKTDHHWTTPGAYTAYTQLCNKMNLTATPETQFNKKSYNDFYGTTYSTSALWFNDSDNIEIWTDKTYNDKNISVEIREGEDVKKYNNLFFYNHLKEDDKYPVFLDGNHAYEKIINTSCTTGKRLLILKDSFAHSLTPFLTANYSEIIMVDLRYYKASMADVLKTEKIDEVLILYGMENICTDSDIKMAELS